MTSNTSLVGCVGLWIFAVLLYLILFAFIRFMMGMVQPSIDPYALDSLALMALIVQTFVGLLLRR